MISRFKVPLALLVAALGVGWLVMSGVMRNDMFMAPLSSFDPQRARRETVKVMGFVQEGSIKAHAEELVRVFTIRDEARTKSLPVRYHGVTPDMFKDGGQVIAAGRLGDDGVFACHELMTKCPSKYEGLDNPHGDKSKAQTSALAP